MGGEAYWRAGQVTGDAEIQEAVRGLLEWILHKAPRAADGTLYHVFKDPQVWSDGFNGAPPFLAATGTMTRPCGRLTVSASGSGPKKKLLAHIWDDGEKADNRKRVLGGGNGWAAAGLARVIRALPVDRKEDRQRLRRLSRN